MDDDVDHFLFGGKGNAEEFFRALHAGALGVDDRAARRARAAGRVHDQIAVAVVGDDDQKLVFRVLHGGFLPLLVVLVLGQELQLAPPADGAERDRKGDAHAGHVDLQLAPQAAAQLLPFLVGDEAREHAFVAALETEVIERFVARRAESQRDELHRHLPLAVKREEGRELAALGDGDHHG